MSRKYLVLTEVDGALKMLALTSNVEAENDLARQCGQMLTDLFRGCRVDGFIVEPWPMAPAQVPEAAGHKA